MVDSRLRPVLLALRITFGVVPIVAGLDKFFNLLTRWDSYLSPLALRVLPISGPAFMRVVGVIEVVAGALVLSRWTRFGAGLVGVWLTLIALNLISSGRFLDVAVRDLVMAVSAFCYLRLATVAEGARASDVERGPGGELTPAGART